MEYDPNYQRGTWCHTCHHTHTHPNCLRPFILSPHPHPHPLVLWAMLSRFTAFHWSLCHNVYAWHTHRCWYLLPLFVHTIVSYLIAFLSSPPLDSIPFHSTCLVSISMCVSFVSIPRCIFFFLLLSLCFVWYNFYCLLFFLLQKQCDIDSFIHQPHHTQRCTNCKLKTQRRQRLMMITHNRQKQHQHQQQRAHHIDCVGTAHVLDETPNERLRMYTSSDSCMFRLLLLFLLVVLDLVLYVAHVLENRLLHGYKFTCTCTCVRPY